MTLTHHRLLSPNGLDRTSRRPALFLDRDGVINHDHGYVHRTQDFIFIDGIFELVKAANSAGYLCIIATNQSGIARGLYSEATFCDLMAWVIEQFSRNGGRIDAVYYCPHHPTAAIGHYQGQCQCRKPKPGMLLQAAADWNIALISSILVGDSPSDIAAGDTAGVGRSALFSPADSHSPSPNTIRNLAELLPYFHDYAAPEPA